MMWTMDLFASHEETHHVTELPALIYDFFRAAATFSIP